MSQYGKYPPQSGGVQVYPTFADFPSNPPGGTLAVAADTDTLYVYDSATSTWVAIASPGDVLSVANTNSIDLSVTANVLRANLNLSAASAPSLSQNVVLQINSDGLQASILNSSIAASLSATAPLVLTGSVFSITESGASSNGYLSSTDWNTFNNKQSTLTLGNLTDTGTDGISITGGTGAVVGSGTTISQLAASGSQNGYLSSTNWSTFNGKQAAGNYITALTGDVTAAGPGSAAATVAAIQGNAVSGTTGSGNVAFSGSPTFTGTIIAAAQTLSGLLTLKAGSAASPSTNFTGSTNTGLYAPGANQIGFSTNGILAAYFDASQNLNIATTGGQINFSSNANNFITGNYDGAGRLGISAETLMGFEIGGDGEIMTLGSGGMVLEGNMIVAPDNTCDFGNFGNAYQSPPTPGNEIYRFRDAYIGRNLFLGGTNASGGGGDTGSVLYFGSNSSSTSSIAGGANGVFKATNSVSSIISGNNILSAQATSVYINAALNMANGGSTPNIIWNVDGSGSIGASGATRPANLYLSSKLYVKGTVGNATAGATSCGTVTLAAGTATVSTTAVTANSIILLTPQSLGTVSVATPLAITARSVTTPFSFTITSASITDTSVVGWVIVEPN